MDDSVVAVAESLRWIRPDLTAALAEHALDMAAARGERERWLAAAGWLVNARSATGDGRVVASELLEELPRWGDGVLGSPAAGRLRVEVSVFAQDLGQARTLLRLPAAPDPALRADGWCAFARCVGDTSPVEAAEALMRADDAWAEVGGLRGDIGSAAVALVRAAMERRSGRASAAADRAAEGLARLDRGRGGLQEPSPSRHLAAGLAAEWISALTDADRLGEAREGSALLQLRLADASRPSRQLATLRLTVGRIVATGTDDDAAATLEKAAREAAESDSPGLESACWATLGALHERLGRRDPARDARRSAATAQRRDEERSARFGEAITAVIDGLDERPAGNGTGHDAWSWAAPSGNGSGSRSRGGEVDGPVHRTNGTGPRSGGSSGDPAGPGPDAVVDPLGDAHWVDPSSDSPIGDMLARDLRLRSTGSRSAGSAGPDEDSRRHRTSASGAGVPGGDAPGGDAPGHDLPTSAADVGTPASSVPPVPDPWSTGRWTAGTGQVSDGRGDTGHRTLDAAAQRGARRSVDPSGRVRHPSERVGDAPSTSLEQMQSRLTTALSDLDRTMGRSPEGPATPVVPEIDKPATPTPDVEGCVVVIDIARDGRRFASPRAGAVIRVVADRISDLIPPGARLRHDGADALSVVLPGRGRSAVAAWMHRTLPALLEGVAVAEDMPDTQLRAAVHDVDGPVGAQILQRIDLGSGRDSAVSSSPAPQPPTDVPAADLGRTDAAAGRHDAGGRAAFRPQGRTIEPGSGGRRRRSDGPLPGSGGGPPHVDPTDGLGLADLLAGALAAYRGI